jgi:hypothetical protein
MTPDPVLATVVVMVRSGIGMDPIVGSPRSGEKPAPKIVSCDELVAMSVS